MNNNDNSDDQKTTIKVITGDLCFNRKQFHLLVEMSSNDLAFQVSMNIAVWLALDFGYYLKGTEKKVNFII